MANETTEICAEKAPMQNSTDIYSITAPVDYTRTEPYVIHETAQWAVVYKPPHLPTAPLRADERATLVYWFLHRSMTGENTQPDTIQFDEQPDGMPIDTLPDDRQTAAQVRGKKAIEAGLLHRLDTDTRGLVLFAKDQAVYDFLAARQEAGQMIKTYCAFVEANRSSMASLKVLTSQFRNFGPGAKRVAPVFSGSRHYKKGGRQYTTIIESIERLPSLPPLRVRCRLSRGYRHQVRAHLAAVGLPIVGDPLYAPQGAEAQPKSAQVGLQLYAVSLEFPDPENPQRNICVALPPPDRMNP